MTKSKFASVALDVDSTVSGIEGIDWLATRRGDIVSRRVADLTAQAMQGTIPLEQVYRARLDAIRPRRDDIEALARAYVDELAPGCAEAISKLRHAEVRVILVSSGIRNALLRMALQLNFDVGDVHAVDVRFDTGGAYAGFDASSPLTTSIGKRALLASLPLPRPLLMVGDGATDLATRGAVDSFAAFTGFVARDAVVRQADAVISSFAELVAYVLSS
ncbi:MAG TPA: HAD-IB family phosphatase [Gemmatimonadaceae bacterium]